MGASLQRIMALCEHGRAERVRISAQARRLSAR
jgi:hypothetical protein